MNATFATVFGYVTVKYVLPMLAYVNSVRYDFSGFVIQRKHKSSLYEIDEKINEFKRNICKTYHMLRLRPLVDCYIWTVFGRDIATIIFEYLACEPIECE